MISAGRHPLLCSVLIAAAATLLLSACGSGGSKDYDIAPVFPLSSDKCDRYDGDSEGEGISSHCWVTLEQCEHAVADWRASMQQSGVTDAVQFSCR